MTTSGETLVIEPSTGLLRLRLKEIWRYRELLYFLVWRDVKVRYKQTLLGAAWAILQPLLLMVVFTIFLSRLAGVSSEGLPYPLFSFAALVPWTFFAQSLNGSSQSLVGNSHLITKVYFPRLIIPLAATGSFLIDFSIAFVVLIGMMVAYGIAPSLEVLWVLPLTALALLVSLAIGIWFAALNVRYRDVKYAVPFLIQLWLFATPVAYSANLVPERFQTLLGINPMAGVATGFRWALLGTVPPDLGLMAASVTVTAVTFVGGLIYFQGTERSFADVI